MQQSPVRRLLAVFKKMTRKGFFRHILGLLLLALLLALVDARRVVDAMAKADFSLLALGLGLSLLVVAVRGLRWWRLVRGTGRTYSVWRCLRVALMSLFFSMITPGRLGELGKGLLLGREDARGQAELLTTVLIDRFWDVGVVFLAALAAFAWTPIRLEFQVSSLALASILALLVIAAIVVAVRFRWATRLASRLTNLLGGLDARSAWESARRLARRTAWMCLISTALGWLLYFVAGYALASSLGIQLEPSVLVLVVAGGSIVSLLPITFSGVGARDGFFILCFREVGLEPEQAIAFSLLFLLTNAFLAACGWFAYVRRGALHIGWDPP